MGCFNSKDDKGAKDHSNEIDKNLRAVGGMASKDVKLLLLGKLAWVVG